MNILDLALMGLKNLFRRKARTILTTLGVLIGTTSILVMISIGLGMDKAFQEEIEQYGNITMITVNPGWKTDVKPSDNKDDVTKLNDFTIKQFRGLEHVKGVVGVKEFQAKLISGRYESYSSLVGIDLKQLGLLGIKLGEGQLPSEGAEVLLGADSTRFRDPKSKNYDNQIEIDIFEQRLELISTEGDSNKRKRGLVVTPTGVTTDTDYQNSYRIFIDYDIYKKYYDDYRRKNKIKIPRYEDLTKYSEIYVLADNIKTVSDIQSTIEEMGYEAHSLTEWLDSTKKFSSLVQKVLGGIAAVSLFVAAIGITNTMIMSIYERKKEIGVMKVIGAKLKDIRRLFLFEAGMIGLLGGVIGALISVGGSYFLNSIFSRGAEDGGAMGIQLKSYLPLWLVLAGIAFSVIIGLLAGFYPAYKATKLSALEAISSD